MTDQKTGGSEAPAIQWHATMADGLPSFGYHGAKIVCPNCSDGGWKALECPHGGEAHD